MSRIIFDYVFMPFVALYVAFHMIPPTVFWFDPGTPIFTNVESGEVPRLQYTRDIKRATWVRYTVVVREALPDDAPPGDIVCEGTSGVFTYRKQSGPLVGQDLLWWVPQDERCGSLPDGVYWAETCWNLVNPLGDLLPWRPRDFLGPFAPKKSICRTSPAFYIGVTPEEVEQMKETTWHGKEPVDLTPSL